MSAGFSSTSSLCLPGFLPLPPYVCRVFFHSLIMFVGFSSTLSLCLSGFLPLCHYVCRFFFHISATIFRISVPPNSLSNLRHVFSLISTTFPSSSSPSICVFLIRLRYVFSSLFFSFFFHHISATVSSSSLPHFFSSSVSFAFSFSSVFPFSSPKHFLSYLRHTFSLISATLSL